MTKKIDYFSIVKEAIKLTKENKSLWWFGFLMALGGGISFNFPSGGGDEKMDEMKYMNMVRQVSFYWENYREWIILGVVVLILILLTFFILSLIGKAALTDSVFKILQGEKIGFKAGFKNGTKYLWGILAISLSFFFISLIILAILTFPVIRLFMAKAYGWGILFGFVAILIFFSFATFAYFIRKYGQIYLISSQVNFVEAMKLGYNLAEKNLGKTLMMMLVSFVVGMIMGFGVVLIIIILAIPTVILGFILNLSSLEGPMMIGLIFLGGALLMSLIMFISSVYNVFFETMWILFFREIAQEEKPQEDKLLAEEAEKDILIKEGSVGTNNL